MQQKSNLSSFQSLAPGLHEHFSSIKDDLKQAKPDGKEDYSDAFLISDKVSHSKDKKIFLSQVNIHVLTTIFMYFNAVTPHVNLYSTT